VKKRAGEVTGVAREAEIKIEKPQVSATSAEALRYKSK
jgi:hypothetical protein